MGEGGEGDGDEDDDALDRGGGSHIAVLSFCVVKTVPKIPHHQNLPLRDGGT